MRVSGLAGLAFAMLVPMAAQAFASDPTWQWDENGADSLYTGNEQIGLNNDSFTREAGTSLSKNAVSQPPIVISLANDIEFDLVQTGTPVPKPDCIAPETAKIYVTPVTACNAGVGTAIGGIHVYADDDGTNFIPRLQVWVHGLGWQAVNDHACGMVEVKTMCR
ncbi:hypothetical protein [Geopseudomonas aromaticivorans]